MSKKAIFKCMCTKTLSNLIPLLSESINKFIIDMIINIHSNKSRLCNELVTNSSCSPCTWRLLINGFSVFALAADYKDLGTISNNDQRLLRLWLSIVTNTTTSKVKKMDAWMWLFIGHLYGSTSTSLSSFILQVTLGSSWHSVGRRADSLLQAGTVNQVDVAHPPPPLHPRLQLLPVSERVGELAESHTQRAQLVRGQGGGGGQRAEGLWGSGSWTTVDNS